MGISHKIILAVATKVHFLRFKKCTFVQSISMLAVGIDDKILLEACPKECNYQPHPQPLPERQGGEHCKTDNKLFVCPVMVPSQLGEG